MKRILFLSISVLSAFVIVSATARDLDGRYADSPLHDWFNQSRKWQRSLLLRGRWGGRR